MKEEWKDKLQHSMADYKEAAPEGLWNDIEKALSDNGITIGKQAKPKHRTKVIAIRSLAAAACASAIVGVFLNIDKHQDGKPLAATNATTGKPSANSSVATTYEKLAAIDGKNKAERHIQANLSKESIDTGNARCMNEETSTDSNEIPENTAEDTQHTTDKTTNKAERNGQSVVINKDTYPQSYPQHNTRSGHAYAGDSHIRHNEPGGSRITASLFAANTMANSSTQTARVATASSDILLFCMPSDEDFDNGINYLVGKGENESVNHHQPVRIGMSVRYALNEKVGIETGLTYSYLSSDIKQGASDNCMLTQQKLHFIGIPLNVDYKLWRNRWLDVYASAGGMVEKNIKGKTSTEYTLNSRILSEETGKVKMKQLQWSANVAAGLQFNATKELEIYVEPGVGYYFDNGSSVKTAYSEKPFNFNLKFGLRYSFE